MHLISLAGGDYTPLTTDLTFGNATGARMVTIVILDDLLFEDSEFFNVTLTTTDPSVTLQLEPDAATVTIEDEDSKLPHTHSYAHRHLIQLNKMIFSLPRSGITIGFYCPARYSVYENADSVSVTIEILRGSPARNVTVTLQTVDGSAVGKVLTKLKNS